MVHYLKKGNKIYLLIKNLKTRNRVKNLIISRSDFFLLKIIKKIVSYQLKLPKNVKI